MTCGSLPFNPAVSRPLARSEMRRELDYLRKMLADMEASPNWQHLIGVDDGSDDPSADNQLYNAKLMQDEGLGTNPAWHLSDDGQGA